MPPTTPGAFADLKIGLIPEYELGYRPPMVNDVVALLRERGIQVTAQRLAVLRAVSGQPHITADAVTAVVRAEIGAISLQSVYDTLALLVSEGLLRRIQPAGSPARFEDRVGDNHHHLICRTCGRVVDVDCAVGSAPCLTAHADGGYEIDEAEVAFWGRCPDCLEQAGSPSPGVDPPTALRDHERNPRPTSTTTTATGGRRTPQNEDRRRRRSR